VPSLEKKKKKLKKKKIKKKKKKQKKKKKKKKVPMSKNRDETRRAIENYEGHRFEIGTPKNFLGFLGLSDICALLRWIEFFFFFFYHNIEFKIKICF